MLIRTGVFSFTSVIRTVFSLLSQVCNRGLQVLDVNKNRGLLSHKCNKNRGLLSHILFVNSPLVKITSLLPYITFINVAVCVQLWRTNSHSLAPQAQHTSEPLVQSLSMQRGHSISCPPRNTGQLRLPTEQ